MRHKTVPKIELEPVIAERRLHVLGHPELDVRVRVGAPRPFDEESGNHYCPYQVVGIGDEKVRFMGGVDGVQALELTIRILPLELEALLRRVPDLRWGEARKGSFGFYRRRESRRSRAK